MTGHTPTDPELAAWADRCRRDGDQPEPLFDVWVEPEALPAPAPAEPVDLDRVTGGGAR